jgi:long-chain acyl-CoA synthetase
MHRLANLVCFDSTVTPEDRAGAEAAGLKLYTMEEVIVRGQAEAKTGNVSVKAPEPDDIYMFSYTSGTTGDPKGVMLSHKMILGAAYAAQSRLATVGSALDEKDTYISYLPAAHSFEQVLFGVSILYGVRTGFFAGNVLKLTDDIALLKPTLFPSVPRLYNKIYGKIQDKFKAATGIKAWLVNKAVAAKLHYYENGQGLTHKLYDALVFGKV